MTFRRTALVAAVALATVTLVAPTAAFAGNGNGSGPGNANANPANNGQTDRQAGFTIGLWGDQPYGPAGLAVLPKVIADINKQELLFTVFDGDIKSGSSLCTDDQYALAQSTFSQITWPTVYTPGDNEWTDCDRLAAGDLDPNAQLDMIRGLFFADGLSQGASRMPVEQQSAEFPENARWFHDGITFITVNVPGTDNNYPQTKNGLPIDADKVFTSVSHRAQNGDLAEYTARNAANLAWLEDGFRYAQTHGSKGIMIVQQADMWSPTDPIAHYADEKAKLAELVASTKRPVVLVNGDTHVFAVDNPLVDAGGNVVPNFQRVTTDGETNFGWTKVDIAPNAQAVFTFSRQVVTP